MGMFDTVIVKCPKCKSKYECQTKSGECLLSVYSLKKCPDDILADVNRHSPYSCDCGTLFKVDIEARKSVIASDPIYELREIRKADIANKLQDECHKFVAEHFEKSIMKRSHLSYQDATNAWLFNKLAELELRIQELGNNQE